MAPEDATPARAAPSDPQQDVVLAHLTIATGTLWSMTIGKLQGRSVGALGGDWVKTDARFSNAAAPAPAPPPPAPAIAGCMDPVADNYNPLATSDAPSTCIYPRGCMDRTALNFDPLAMRDDGSCEIPGCIDSAASNFNTRANVDDGLCIFPGCTNSGATNYDPRANQDDNSCVIPPTPPGSAQLCSINSLFTRLTAIKSDADCRAGCQGSRCPPDWYPGSGDVCNADCGAVFEPFWDECGAMLVATGMGGMSQMAAFYDSCLRALYPPGSCGTFCNAHTYTCYLSEVHASCCDEDGTNCVAGQDVPLTCPVGCALVFPEFLETCRAHVTATYNLDMHAFETFEQTCLTQDGVQLVEYAMSLIAAGCTLDFSTHPSNGGGGGHRRLQGHSDGFLQNYVGSSSPGCRWDDIDDMAQNIDAICGGLTSTCSAQCAIATRQFTAACGPTLAIVMPASDPRMTSLSSFETSCIQQADPVQFLHAMMAANCPVNATNATTHATNMTTLSTPGVSGSPPHKIYALGGSPDPDGSPALNIVEAYDPSTNTWAAIAPMGTMRYGLAASTLNGKIYALGGNGPSGTLNIAEAYHPSNGTWTTIAPMGTMRYGLAATTLNGKIYAVGGHGNGYDSYLNIAEAYDPNNNTWTTIAPMGTARRYLAATTLNDKIYALGGYDRNGWGGVNGLYFNITEAYDPNTNTWTPLASMVGAAREGLAATTLNGKIYALGGYDGSSFFNIAEVYDPSTNTWTMIAPMGTARAGLAATTVNGKIYALGGTDGSSTFNIAEAYDPSTNTWTTIAPMGTARGFVAAVTLG
jgi:N-acetylneuraminic acid mutarotase